MWLIFIFCISNSIFFCSFYLISFLNYCNDHIIKKEKKKKEIKLFQVSNCLVYLIFLPIDSDKVPNCFSSPFFSNFTL